LRSQGFAEVDIEANVKKGFFIDSRLKIFKIRN
jgi:hypothetical protein